MKINIRYAEELELEDGSVVKYSSWPDDKDGTPICKSKCEYVGGNVVVLSKEVLDKRIFDMDKEQLIRDEGEKIIREMAIASLIKSGKVSE